MHPHTSYLIYATPRCGSYLLCEALLNTGLAEQPIEYFLLWWTKALLNHRDLSNYAECIARILQAGTTHNGVFGGKILWHDFEDLIDRLQSISGNEKLAVPELMATVFPNLRYIWITRRDKVRQAISYWKALQTNSWILSQGWQHLTQHIFSWEEGEIGTKTEIRNRQPSDKEVTFDFRAIERLLHNIQQDEVEMEQYFTACGVQPFKVVYEDFVQTYEQTALQILEYLQIPVPKDLVFVEQKMKKPANEQSEEWIQRYYQIKHQEKSYQQGVREPFHLK